jgi:hypothetical protein
VCWVGKTVRNKHYIAVSRGQGSELVDCCALTRRAPNNHQNPVSRSRDWTGLPRVCLQTRQLRTLTQRRGGLTRHFYVRVISTALEVFFRIKSI